MPTAKQRDRLIDAIAYIRSHRRNWDQGNWVNSDRTAASEACGTVGCLAGHVAISLNPSTPVVKPPLEALKKPARDRTNREISEISLWMHYSSMVQAIKADLQAYVLQVNIDGKQIPAIHVRERAARLLGIQVNHDLFNGNNKMADMLRIAAQILDMSQADLRSIADERAKAYGWVKVKASA